MVLSGTKAQCLMIPGIHLKCRIVWKKIICVGCECYACWHLSEAAVERKMCSKEAKGTCMRKDEKNTEEKESE